MEIVINDRRRLKINVGIGKEGIMYDPIVYEIARPITSRVVHSLRQPFQNLVNTLAAINAKRGIVSEMTLGIEQRMAKCADLKDKIEFAEFCGHAEKAAYLQAELDKIEESVNYMSSRIDRIEAGMVVFENANSWHLVEEKS